MAGRQYELLFQLKATYGNNFAQTFSNASKAIKDMQGSIKKVNQLQKDISGYKRQEESLNKNREKVQALKEEHDKLQREISETEKPTEKMRKALERNKKQLEQTWNAIDAGEKSLEKLGEELKAAGVNTDNLEASTNKLQQRYQKLQQSQEKIGNLSNRIEKNNAAISQTKTQLVGVIGAAGALGAAFYAGPITKAAEFQHQMSKVKAISGATAEELSELSSKAKQMGATTEFTAAQAGEAMEYMSMAGWKTSDMLNGIEGIMYLASASGEELATTSDIVTDALTAFGLTAADATHFSDVLAQASSNANTNVGMMGSTFQKVAPVAGALGYSVEDMSLGIGLMANASIKAEVAGTSLKTAIANMASPTEKQATAMEKYGISLTRTDGSMKSFGEVIENMRGSLGGLNEVEQTAAATTIFGKESFAGMLAIINASEKDYKKLSDAVYNCDGAAKQMSETMLDNFEGKMTLAKSALDALQVSLGEALLPTFTQAVTKITEVISKVAEFAEKNPELVRTIAKVTGGLFALKAGGLVAKLGFQEIQGGVFKTQKFLEIFKGRTLIASTNAMGLGAKLTKMGGSVAGYFGNLGGAFSNIISSSSILSKVTGAAKLIGGKLSGGVLGVFGKIGGKITGVFGMISGKAISTFGKIGSAVLAGPLGKIGGFFAKIAGSIGTALAPVGNLLKVAFSPLANLGGALFGSFGGIVGKIFPIVAAITAVVTVVQLVRKNLDKIRDFVGKIFGEKGLEIFDKIIAVISSIGDTIKNVFSDGNIGIAREKIQEIFGDKGAAVFDKFVSVFKTVQGVVGQFVAFVTQHIVPVAEQIFSVIATTVIPGIISAVQTAAPIVMSIISTIATFIGQAAGVIGEFIAGIMPIISEIITFLQANVFPIVGAIFNLIVTTVLPAIASGIQTAANIIINIISTLLPFIQTAITTIWSVVQPILQAALSFIQFMMPTIQSIVSNVINTISGIINGLLTVLQGIIQFITGVFTGNWSQAWEGVKNIFSGAFEGLKAIASGVMNGIISVLNTGIRGLNKIKIPDWVPGVGGKGINIPEIPQFAKGTESTPDTFIAGENGPELITGAANRKVFTAMQTQNIFNNMASQSVTDSDTPTAQGLKASGGMIQITINNNPQIQAAGGETKDIESLLRQANEEFLTKVKGLVKQALMEAGEREERVNYA